MTTEFFSTNIGYFMKERLIIIVLAVVSGLIITTAAFFIYQNFINTSNSATSSQTNPSTSPTPIQNDLLEVLEPADGSLTDNRTISVKGVTSPENVVIVSTNQEDNSGKPTPDGNFSITVTIDAGANFLVVRSISPQGDEIKKEIVVTYNTEEF